MGAVLTQHTAWVNAARALAALRARRLLTPARLAAVEAGSLAQVIRSAGTPRVKARRLRALTRWILERAGGSLRRMRTMPLEPLRAELLEIPGIGPETADAILLYSAGRPVFVAPRGLPVLRGLAIIGRIRPAPRRSAPRRRVPRACARARPSA